MDHVYGNERSFAYEAPPPYSPVRGNGGNGFLDEEKGEGIVVRIVRTWTKTATTHIAPAISSSARNTTNFLQQRTWPTIKDYPLKWAQAWGFLLLCLGLVPFVTYGILVKGGMGTEGFYYGAFAAKTLSCGNALGTPQNSTVGGVEALFVLDWTFGQFTFAKVKTIDVAWDILVGRGVQMVFWAISYRVFTDALLRLIERHPASYSTFMSLSLEGASLSSSWNLLKQLFRHRSKRTWFLFYYLLLASFYVLSIPPLLGAMTGYDSRTIAWVSIGDPDNIVPASMMEESYTVYGTWNDTFASPLCDKDTPELRDWSYHVQDTHLFCKCRLPNSTTLPYEDWSSWFYSQPYQYGFSASAPKPPYAIDDCKINFPGNNKLYNSSYGPDAEYPYRSYVSYNAKYTHYPPARNWSQTSCNATFPVTLPSNNITYSMYDLNFTTAGLCFQNKSYDRVTVEKMTRCLPDTAHPSYAWGFSSALTGVVFIINLAWCLSMWVVWQDALRGVLVRGGYGMTPLRAAFVLTEAARRRTGISGCGLVVKERKVLKEELREAVVERVVFEDGSDGWGGIRRRPVGALHVGH